MSKLIDQLKENYNLIEIKPIILKGFQKNIVLKRYKIVLEPSKKRTDQLVIFLNQLHKNSVPSDLYKLLILNSEEFDDFEAHPLFQTNEFEVLDTFPKTLISI